MTPPVAPEFREFLDFESAGPPVKRFDAAHPRSVRWMFDPMNAQTLPQVTMPNRDAFRQGDPRPDVP